MPRLLSPRYWGAHVLALVLVGTAGLLGWWQYDAWQARRSAEAVDLTQAEPRALADVMGPDDQFPGADVGRPVTVEGTWVPDGTVYVSGREHAGREGFWVVTPLAVDGGGEPATAPALPVVLGWTPSVEEAPAPVTGRGELTAWLQPSEGTGVVDDDRSDDVLPQVRTADLIQHVDQDLYGAYVVAQEPPAGLVAADLEQLPEASTFTALRNLLYALEWLVFGAFAAFIWWRWIRDQRDADDTTGGAVPSDEVAPADRAVPSEA